MSDTAIYKITRLKNLRSHLQRVNQGKISVTQVLPPVLTPAEKIKKMKEALSK